MKGFTIALISCMFLALESVFSKVLLRQMSPIAVTALTSIFAAVILFFILEAEEKMKEVWTLKRKEFLILLAIGIISGVLAQLLYVTGLRDSTATNAVLLTRLNSLLIALLGVVIIKEKLNYRHLLGSALMISGIVIIATRFFEESVNMMKGDGLLVLAAVFWASANILMKKYLTRLSPEVIVIWYYGFSGAVLLGICWQDIPMQLSAEAIIFLAAQVLLVSVIGRYLWYYSFEHANACDVGIASLSMPLFGVIYAAAFLGERMQPYQALGGALIFAGLVSIEWHATCHPDTEHPLKRHHPHH
jgi:drug/metabolite transporter (DMT)-like permease